jgi:hypothetical protein
MPGRSISNKRLAEPEDNEDDVVVHYDDPEERKAQRQMMSHLQNKRMKAPLK